MLASGPGLAHRAIQQKTKEDNGNRMPPAPFSVAGTGAPVPGIPTGSTGLGLETNPTIGTGTSGQISNAEAQSSPDVRTPADRSAADTHVGNCASSVSLFMEWVNNDGIGKKPWSSPGQ